MSATPVPKTTGLIGLGPDFDLLLKTLGYVYLIRVPLLLFIAAVLMTAGGLLPNGPGRSILRGIYDIGLPSEPGPRNMVRFLFLTFTVLAFATTLAMTAWTTLTCAHARFGNVRIPESGGVRLACVGPPLLLGGVIIFGCAARSRPWLWALVGVGLGVLVFSGFLLLSRALQKPDIWKKFHRYADDHTILSALPALVNLIEGLWAVSTVLKKLVEKIPGDPAGYREGDGTVLTRHRLAASFATTSLIAYIVMWLIKSNTTNPGAFGSYPRFPTLALILLLGILIGLVFSGITFFLDRYRVPIIVPIALYISFTSSFPQSDHFYHGLARTHRNREVTPEFIFKQAGQGRMVVVAATGGGIQAAAWATRVLRQLQWTAQQRGRDFAPAVRLISAVSGGSVGAMYFANSYQAGNGCGPRVDDIEKDCVIRASEASSLDEVAAGLVYEDLTLNLVPFVKGLDFRPFRLVNGRNLMADRGNALENALKRIPGVDDPLLKWKADAEAGLRPAVIFNATIVENGERLLLSTTDLDDQRYCEGPLNAEIARDVRQKARANGRVDFHRLYCSSDVAVATAVRLSATFPFVSPAARIFEGDLHWPSVHVVDGGYSDNYGMASLVEWLDRGMSLSGFRGNVMVIEIRSSSPEPDIAPPSERGFLFQTLNPATALINVRSTGQFSHDQLELRLIRERYPNRICPAVFQYTPPLDRGQPRPEPLSWHLTPGDMEDLRSAWKWQNGPVEQVMSYLETGTCKN